MSNWTTGWTSSSSGPGQRRGSESLLAWPARVVARVPGGARCQRQLRRVGDPVEATYAVALVGKPPSATATLSDVQPYLGGGFGHFYAYAPVKNEYAINRFAMEVKREFDVLDRRLAESERLGGSEYSITDMAVFPWYGALVKGLVYSAGEFLSVHEYKNVLRWTDAIAARPAVQRGRMVNRPFGDPSEQLLERPDASDFQTKTQDKVQKSG